MQEFLPSARRVIGHDRNSLRATFSVSSFLGLIVLLVFSFGCGGPSSSPGGSTSSNDVPELTDEVIHERINDARVREVPAENGTAPPIVWNFEEHEPKEIAVIEKQVDGTRATIVLDIETGSSPRARNPRHLAGQIRTEWALRTGWVLRRWEIVGTENISMTYKDLPKSPPDSNLPKLPPDNSNIPKPAAQNSNR